jgi:tetratricopeptide (TPR) repeat protein
LNSGHADKAVASLAEAIKLRPEGVAAWREHAQALRKLNRLDEAQASIDEAWRMNPLDTYTLVIRSGILARAGRTDEAWAPYEDWVATDKTGYALNARCWQRGLLNVDLAKAEADCAAAVKLTPKASAYWDSYALIALRDGRLTDALQRYDQALTLTPKMSQALYGRGLVKLRSGDERGGQADIDAAKALNPEVAEELTEAGVTPSMGGLRPGQDRGLDRGG